MRAGIDVRPVLESLGTKRTVAKARTGRYIPTLDGWRAIAVVSVFFAHIRPLPLPGWAGHKLAMLLWNNGGRGVGIFFGISGLLICSRLLDEEDRFGRISLKAFYIRRAFRILPPALFFLLVLAALHRFGPIPLAPLDWFASLFFFRNYTVSFAGPPLSWWFTSHFWSLSVEEHFYLILPALLVLLPTWRGRLRALLGLALLSTIWKLCVLAFFQSGRDPLTIWFWLEYHTEGVIDALLIPAAIAVYLRKPEAKRQLERWFRSPARLAVFVPLGLFFFYRYQIWPMAKLAVPLFILATVFNPESVVGRLLESAPLRWIGRLSYSLYLWQMLFLCTRLTTETPMGRMETFPWNLACLLACACFSYYIVEQPMIRIGHALTRSSYLAPVRETEPVKQPTEV